MKLSKNLNSLLSTKKEELINACRALEDRGNEVALLEKSLEEGNLSQNEEISKLHALLQQKRDQADSLRVELQKAKTALVLKDDEIRELQMVELQDYEKEVGALREELSSKESDIKDAMERLQALSLQQLEREHIVAEEVGKLDRLRSDVDEGAGRDRDRREGELR